MTILIAIFILFSAYIRSVHSAFYLFTSLKLQYEYYNVTTLNDKIYKYKI